MENKINFSFLINESRGRVYLLWAVLTGVGYTATHYYQHPNINGVWFVLSAIGFAYMYKVMPLRVKQMKYVYMSWAVPISVGLIVSILSARTELLPGLLGYLGAYWLAIQAVGFLWNGLVDSPGIWYYVASVMNGIGAISLYLSESLLPVQYLLAGIITVWSMLMLWLYRTDA